MQEIDLAEFEWKLRVRPLQLADFPAVVALQKLSFPDMQPWSREQFESQLEQFPEGQIGIECDGRLVASSSSLILSYDEQTEWHNYKKLSDSGYIRNHVPDGDTLYGIEIMVDPEYRGMRLSRRLYDERKELCRHKNLARIMIGGRIPGFHQHADEMTAREYIERVMDKSLYDPVLTAQLANGFALQGLIPNYLPSDHASRGYATFLEWKNLDYQSGLRKRYQRNFEPVRIGAVQYQMRPVADFDEFARQAEYFVDVAGDYKCDFLLFPELFTTQLLSCIPPERPGQAARKLATFTPRYLEFFTEVAVKYDTNIIGGS
ncbi:GNAT family N-acetyltransferase [Planctomycetaceae bacterium SH139]